MIRDSLVWETLVQVVDDNAWSTEGYEIKFKHDVIFSSVIGTVCPDPILLWPVFYCDASYLFTVFNFVV